MALPHSSSDESELFVTEGTRSYPATDQALRKSCDRCYAQKLRCSKSDASPSRCLRCERAGLRCFYSTRLARQSQKRRASPLENIIGQRSTRPFRPQPLPSPSAEEHVVFDPMSLVTFDVDSHGLNTTFYGEIRSGYAWPPEDWLTGPEMSSTFSAVSTLDQGLLGNLPQSRVLEHQDTAPGPSSESQLQTTQQLGNQHLIEQPPEASTNGSSNTDIPSSNETTITQANNVYLETLPNQSVDLQAQERASTGVRSNTELKITPTTPLDELACLARRLEHFHHKMTTAEPPQDLQSYPVGETLDGSRTLLKILRQDISAGGMQCYNPYIQTPTYDQSPSSSRTTNSLLALQCYILCIKILAQMCQKLLSQPAMIAESELQSKRSDRGVIPSRTPGTGQSTSDERPNDLVDGALAIPLYSDLRLGELHSHLDPFGHSLNCICAALSAGMKLLRAIEVSLGIPKVLGVACEGSPSADRDQTNVLNGVGSTGSEPTTPILTLARRGDNQHTYFDPRARSNSGSTQSFLERMVTVLWDQESMLEASKGSQETSLAIVRRCSKQILTLARQHMLFSYSS